MLPEHLLFFENERVAPVSMRHLHSHLEQYWATRKWLRHFHNKIVFTSAGWSDYAERANAPYELRKRPRFTQTIQLGYEPSNNDLPILWGKER